MSFEKVRNSSSLGFSRAELEKSFRSFEKQAERIYIEIFKESFPTDLRWEDMNMKGQKRAKKR
jgi:hypothetical protein